MNTPPWSLDWSWIATTWRSGRRSLASLLASNAAPRVPGLDDDVVGWVSEADDDELSYVGAEEVRGSWRCVRSYDSRLALGVGDLLYAAGELGIAR